MAPNQSSTAVELVTCDEVQPIMTKFDQQAQSVRSAAEAAGQGHLFKFWNTLSAEEKAQLVECTGKINFNVINSYFNRLTMDAEELRNLDACIAPLPKQLFADTKEESVENMSRWRTIGINEIMNGTVGVILLAGGQGTRLGSADPKGMYNVGLPSGKSLFQLQGERIRRLQDIASAESGEKCTIPWYVMTSEPTHARTVSFFEANNFFGLDSANIIFFQQNTLPCLTMDGKIILETKSRVAEAPDGNGGIYRALVTGGVMDDMERRGIKYVHAYCVDNVLVKVADPVFMGFCIEREADCGAKVVQKVEPKEAVGVVCQCDNCYRVVEYSEISQMVAQMRDPDGTLTYDAGNICNHFFSIEFLRDICTTNLHSLPLHIAKKKIPTVDTMGNPVKPTANNGIKMEMFIFDVFQFAKNLMVLYVDRDDEFAPLKNAEGAPADTPSDCRNRQMALCRKMVKAAGGSFECENVPCEISPTVSYDGEGLQALCQGKMFTRECPALFLSPVASFCV